MRKEFKEYIEKKRKQSIDHNEKNTRAIDVLESFIKLIEEHSHYAVINARVTKKFACENWSVCFSNEYGSNKIKFSGYVDRHYEQITVYMREEQFTPSGIFARVKDDIASYKRGLGVEDYKEEERILGKIDEIVGNNSFINDLINYGMYNR